MSAFAISPPARILGPLLAVLALSSGASADPGVPPTMPENASRCLSCHGANGNPVLPHVPIIAGQQEAYLLSALMAYRDGGRSGGTALVMARIIGDLNEDDLAELAKWFGAQK